MFGKIFMALKAGAHGAKAIKVVADVTGHYPDKYQMESINELVARDAGVGVYTNEYEIAFAHMLSKYFLTEDYLGNKIEQDRNIQKRILEQFDRYVAAGTIRNNYMQTEYKDIKAKLLGS